MTAGPREPSSSAPGTRGTRRPSQPSTASWAIHPFGEEVEARLAALAISPSDEIYVAEQGGRVVGWVHVALKPSLVDVPSAQVMGLVVREDRRGSGIGRELLLRAEAWAAGRNMRRMLVASRTTRERAHRFYEREGYAVLKQSTYFEKRLGD